MLRVSQLVGFGVLQGGGGCSCTPAYVTGDRTGSITLTSDMTYVQPLSNLVDGGFSDNSSDATWFPGGTFVGQVVLHIDFGATVKVTEAKWYQSTSDSHGSVKYQGSDNDADWTDIGSAFTLGGATTQTHTELNGNAQGYRYYRMLGVSGSAHTTPYLREIEFEQCSC